MLRPKVFRPELKEELRLELAARLLPLPPPLLPPLLLPPVPMAALTLRFEAAEEREELDAVKRCELSVRPGGLGLSPS